MGCNLGAQLGRALHRFAPGFAPDDLAVRRIGEFGCNGDPACGKGDAAGEAIGHPQRRASLATIGVRPPEPEGGSPGNDEKPAQPGEIADQLVGNGVAEIGVGTCIAGDAERQHGYRRPAGPMAERIRLVRLAYRSGVLGPMEAHRAFEAQSFAMDCPD